LRLLSRTGLSNWEEWEEMGFNRLVFGQTVDADDKEKIDEGSNRKNYPWRSVERVLIGD
jgi:hypothetical protein